jgi:DegV family protein with EDD domain
MIHIVSDTDSNLPQPIADELGIPLVPMQIIFGDEVLRERYDLPDAECYARMAAAPKLPTTSQPPVGEFKVLYERMLADDPAGTIISVHLSSAMSGTVVSAQQAAALLPGADIRVFDTRSVSLGQGLMAREAALMARTGASADEIMARLETMRDNMRVYFVLETLDYLARGGRIGRASHLMGTLLDVKPILRVEDGVIGAHSRQRTWGRAVAAIRDMVIADVGGRPGAQIGVVHAASAHDAQHLADDLSEAIHPDVLVLGEVGAGLGVHTGPGALGVCWWVA